SIQQPCLSHKTLDAGRPVKLQHARSQMESPWMRKHMVQHEPCDPMRRSIFYDLSAHLLHHVAEMDTRRARRLARAAIETAEHVFYKRIGDLRAAFVERAHEINAAARRVHLAAEHAVSRT